MFKIRIAIQNYNKNYKNLILKTYVIIIIKNKNPICTIHDIKHLLYSSIRYNYLQTTIVTIEINKKIQILIIYSLKYKLIFKKYETFFKNLRNKFITTCKTI